MNASFEVTRSRLATLLEAMEATPELAAPALEGLRGKFAQHAFHLVVVGEFKRGKSTLINALVGADLLPTGVIPLTSVVTTLQHGEAPAALVEFDSGEHRGVPLQTLAEYVTEKSNPANCKQVREVQVSLPVAWLEGGIRLVDTPGVGSVHSHNSDVTSRYLPTADAVIFVVSADQPLSRNELDFLADVRGYAGKVFCLLNKIDYLSAEERAESLAFTAGVLRDAVGVDVPLFAVSARQALLARTGGDKRGWLESGLAAFDRALQDFLRREGGDVWLDSMRRRLLRLLADGRFALELEQQALVAPLAVLEEKLQVFAQKQAQAQQAAADLDPLLDAESRKLVSQRVEPDLQAFTQALLPETHAAVDGWYHSGRTDSGAVLQNRLEARLVAHVRQAFDAWRATEGVLLTQTFEQQCRRFWQAIHDAADELMRQASELFAVPFTAIAIEPLGHASTGFTYKFWEEPSTMQLVGRGTLRLLPGAISHPLVLRRSHRRATDLVDMQSGRVRHDFEERIRQAAREFGREMHERIDITIEGIQSAVQKGYAARSLGADEVAPRRAALTRALARIDALEATLAQALENS